MKKIQYLILIVALNASVTLQSAAQKTGLGLLTEDQPTEAPGVYTRGGIKSITPNIRMTPVPNSDSDWTAPVLTLSPQASPNTTLVSSAATNVAANILGISPLDLVSAKGKAKKIFVVQFSPEVLQRLQNALHAVHQIENSGNTMALTPVGTPIENRVLSLTALLSAAEEEPNQPFVMNLTPEALRKLIQEVMVIAPLAPAELGLSAADVRALTAAQATLHAHTQTTRADVRALTAAQATLPAHIQTKRQPGEHLSGEDFHSSDSDSDDDDDDTDNDDYDALTYNEINAIMDFALSYFIHPIYFAGVNELDHDTQLMMLSQFSKHMLEVESIFEALKTENLLPDDLAAMEWEEFAPFSTPNQTINPRFDIRDQSLDDIIDSEESVYQAPRDTLETILRQQAEEDVDTWQEALNYLETNGASEQKSVQWTAELTTTRTFEADDYESEADEADDEDDDGEERQDLSDQDRAIIDEYIEQIIAGHLNLDDVRKGLGKKLEHLIRHIENHEGLNIIQRMAEEFHEGLTDRSVQIEDIQHQYALELLRSMYGY